MKKEKMDDKDKHVLPFGDSELISRMILNFLFRSDYLIDGQMKRRIKEITSDEALSYTIQIRLNSRYEVIGWGKKKL